MQNTNDYIKDTKLVSEKQIATDMGISPRTARRLRQSRILPFYRVGKSVRYSREECHRALQQYRVKGAGEETTVRRASR